jgi:hypothetical protein
MSEKYTVPDGEPIPMSQFTLGEGYGSEQMYRDYPDLMPGSRVAYEKDGVLYTDTVQGVSYSSPEAAIWPELTRWQQLVRRFTPARFRKPLKPIRPSKAATVTVSTGPVADDVREQFERAQASIAKAGEFIDGIIYSKP